MLCFKRHRAYYVNDERNRDYQPKLTDDQRIAFNTKRVKSLADDWHTVNVQEDVSVKRIARDLLTFRN